MMQLALFDLDHTLLSGDTDVHTEFTSVMNVFSISPPMEPEVSMPILARELSAPVSPVDWLKAMDRSLEAISLASLSPAKVDRVTLPVESVELAVSESIVDWARL